MDLGDLVVGEIERIEAGEVPARVVLVLSSKEGAGGLARAERRARSEGLLVREGARPPISEEISRIEPAPGMPNDWRVAALPLLV